MKNLNKSLIQTVLLGSFVFSTGCSVHTVHDHGYGPPPHAPAHGYRYKHHGHELVFDSGLGVYVVVGLPGVYFHDGAYYRFDHDHWYYSRELKDDWREYKDDRGLPPGLMKKHGKEKKGKDKGKGKEKDD